MATKRNTFGESLFLRERINDAVDSDMLVIDRLKNLPRETQELHISDSFNLSEKMTKKIVDSNLYIALVEASTLINKDCQCIDDVTTLRKATESNKNHPTIVKMVEKYEVLVDLLACGMDPHSQGIICAELVFSRRSAKTVKALLADQVREKGKGLTIYSSSKKHCGATLFRKHKLQELGDDLESVYADMEKGNHYNGLRLIVELSKKSEVAVGKFTNELLTKSIDFVEETKENKNDR